MRANEVEGRGAKRSEGAARYHTHLANLSLEIEWVIIRDTRTGYEKWHPHSP